MKMFVLFGPSGLIGQNAPRHVAVAHGGKLGNVSCPKMLRDVLGKLKRKNLVILRNVLFGHHGQSGQSAPKHVVVVHREETDNVSC